MGTFCILRQSFLDRLLLPAELSALAEMLRQWYGRRAGGRADQGEVSIEAESYALPAASYPVVQQKLTARVAVARVERVHSDGLKLIGAEQSTGEPIDLSLWNAVLSELSVARGCVILRMTIREPARSLIGAASAGQQTTHRHHETQRLEHLSTRCMTEEGNLRELIERHRPSTAPNAAAVSISTTNFPTPQSERVNTGISNDPDQPSMIGVAGVKMAHAESQSRREDRTLRETRRARSSLLFSLRLCGSA